MINFFVHEIERHTEIYYHERIFPYNFLSFIRFLIYIQANRPFFFGPK